MAATETRLLLLGTVRLFEPVNGYQLRRELLSWGVQDWAHVNPGSIYSGLSTLARQGLLARHDLVDGGREVAAYTTTVAGRAEFDRLWKASVERVDLLDPLPLHTAMTLMPLMDRTEVIAALRRRLVAIDARSAEFDPASPPPSVPPHVVAMADLWTRTGRAQRQWAIDLIARLEAGEFELRGEPTTWQAPPDDPGWQMDIDRARYRELISRAG